MDAVYRFIDKINAENKKDVLSLVLAVVALLSVVLLICSLVVSSTANAGFNIVFTALLNGGFVTGAYYALHNSKTPIAVSIFMSL